MREGRSGVFNVYGIRQKNAPGDLCFTNEPVILNVADLKVPVMCAAVFPIFFVKMCPNLNTQIDQIYHYRSVKVKNPPLR